MSNRIIAITGFMASGKTTVGRALAKRLECAFVDLDEKIVKRDGRPISEIIKADGEPRFRSIETEVLKKELEESNTCVVALGGGTWTIAENRTLLETSNVYVVWLDVPFEVCWSRIMATGGSRPLAPSRAVAEELYRVRKAAYQLANRRLEIDNNMSAVQCAEAIFDALFREETRL